MRHKLKQRIATGLALAGSLIAAVVLLPLPGLALVFALVVAIASWEWSRLAGFQSLVLRIGFVVLALAAMAAMYVYADLAGTPQLERLQPVLGLACLWWAIALLWIKSYPMSGALWGTRPMLALMGLLVLVPAWLSAVFLLSYDSGKLMLLAMVILVAGADIGAYFSGRQWGKTKLAPTVSPGKSWEGVVGGQVTCICLAIAAHSLLGLERIGLPAVIAIAVSGAAASVVGDLLESMVKRHRGVKDSGTLLPGHGGFLDRIDGITAAAPVVALGLILAGWTPS
ncbi:MAG: phosphatidate cytidylyltransferase [Halieaceae bacterium]|jgi:phosphatidate cytidylyltransferase|nr:phosphatidate cytidylyltransferase [Halieaceae bacterium]